MYKPNPRDTSEIVLPTDLITLGEQIAEHVHDTWAKTKIAQGILTHPDLIPYAELSEATKQYDRDTAMQTLRLVIALGFDIVKRPEPEPEPEPLTAEQLSAFRDLLAKRGAWEAEGGESFWSVDFLGHGVRVQCQGGYPGASIRDIMPGFKEDLRALEATFRK